MRITMASSSMNVWRKELAAHLQSQNLWRSSIKGSIDNFSRNYLKEKILDVRKKKSGIDFWKSQFSKRLDSTPRKWRCFDLTAREEWGSSALWTSALIHAHRYVFQKNHLLNKFLISVNNNSFDFTISAPKDDSVYEGFGITAFKQLWR